MESQRSPAATGLDHLFSWLEAQLPAYIVKLCGLGFFESRRGRRKVRARINELGIQPEPVEVVPEIIVRVNVVPGAFECVRLPERNPSRQRSRAPSRASVRIADRCINCFEKSGQITRNSDPAIGERVAESDLGSNQEFCEGPQIADSHREATRDTGRRKPFSISQHQPHGGRANDPEYERQEPLLDSRKTFSRVDMTCQRRVNCPHAAAPE